MKRIILISLILITAVSCGYYPKKHSVSKDKLRIISLVPSLTRELQDLGLTKSIVGATSYCEITKSNDELVVGSAVKVNMEKVLLLKPDIVFAGGLTGENYLKTIRSEGIKVCRFNNPSSYDEICDDFIEIGKITNREVTARKIVNSALHRIDSLRKSIPVKKFKLKFFFQIGANPIYAVVSNTFMDDYITYSGCENIARDLKTGSISRETILARNPDVIFISTMGILGDREKKIWESFNDLSAIKNNKTFIIDSDMACSATVITFVDALEQIINEVYNLK